jgi:hypothetical protein
MINELKLYINRRWGCFFTLRKKVHILVPEDMIAGRAWEGPDHGSQHHEPHRTYWR